MPNKHWGILEALLAYHMDSRPAKQIRDCLSIAGRVINALNLASNRNAEACWHFQAGL
jgi:hypothetical protein